MRGKVNRRIHGGTGPVQLGVAAQDPLPQTARSTVDDQHDVAGRQTQRLRADGGEDEADDTPALSDVSTLSSSPSPSPPPRAALTTRQRRVLGLPPKPRRAGRIVIPGGRYRRREEAEGEWARNGVGRVDVRGFRELRI